MSVSSTSGSPMSAGFQAGDAAVVIPARDEADRIAATVTAAAGLDGVGLVVVVDDGSRDGTGGLARGAGAVVLRHARNRGKAAAMQSGANAVGLVDQRERREQPRHLLFLDADLGESAAHAGSLAAPVLAGQADMTIARSEEHTSELQSRQYLVCRLLLEKKKTTT